MTKINKKHSLNYRNCPGALLFLVVLGAAAVAEEIDEIQVTATRRAIDTHDVSVGATVIAAADVAQNALVTDSLQGRVGTFVQETTPGQGAAVIRGLKGSALLHLVDGMRLNNALFRSAPTQYLALIDPAIIDRVEIARGSSASLYGSDAMGGVVQLLTRQPRIEEDAFTVHNELRLGFDSADLARSLSASTEFGNANLASMVNLGWRKNGNRLTGAGDRVAPTAYESRYLRFASRRQASEQQTWSLDLQFAEQPYTPRIDELIPGFGETLPASAEFAFAPNQRWFAHARHEYAQGWLAVDWTIDAGWQRIVDDRVIRAYDSTETRYEDNESDLLGVSVQGFRELGDSDWLFGAEWYRDAVGSSSRTYDSDTGSGGIVAPRFPDDSTVDQAGLFANLNRRLGATQIVSAGLRYSHVRIDIPAAHGYSASRFSRSDLSGELGWLLHLSDTLNLTANVGRGFRAPNIFDLGTLGERPGNRFNIPTASLEPEHVVQFDAGLKFDNGSWRGELVAWRLRYTDRIISVATGDFTEDGREIVQSRNVAESDLWGIESGVRWQASDALSLAAVVNYSRGSDTDETAVDYPADRMPPLNGRLEIDYVSDAGWEIAGYWLFAGQQHRLSPRDMSDVRIDPAGTAGWGSLGASLRFTLAGGTRLALHVDNVLDHAYRVHGSGIDARGINLGASVEFAW